MKVSGPQLSIHPILPRGFSCSCAVLFAFTTLFGRGGLSDLPQWSAPAVGQLLREGAQNLSHLCRSLHRVTPGFGFLKNVPISAWQKSGMCTQCGSSGAS